LHTVLLCGLLIGHNFVNHFICIRNTNSNFLIFFKIYRIFISKPILLWSLLFELILLRTFGSMSTDFLHLLSLLRSVPMRGDSANTSVRGPENQERVCESLFLIFSHFFVVFSTIFNELGRWI